MPRASKALDAAKPEKPTKAVAKAAKATKAAKSVKATTPAKSTKSAKATTSAKSAKSAESAKATTPAKAAEPAKGAEPEKKAPAAGGGSASPGTSKSAERASKAPKRIEGAGADKFFEEQRVLLEEERVNYVAQAADLKAEADQLAQEMEPGDIQFDEESGEGATAAVDRERDLALSAQARAEVDEIDHALAKLAGGSYGICEGCGQPIPRARLKALPHARLCIACKSGGLSRR